MQIIDNAGATWAVDEGLRSRALQLQKSDEFACKIDHVDLDQIVFLRVSNTKAKFLGKCYYVGKAPNNIIPRFVIGKLVHMGLINLDNVQGFDMDMFDLRFLVVINNDMLNMIPENSDQVEDLTLVHELMHIHPSGDKLVKHDLEDFSSLVEHYGPYWGNGIFSQNDSSPESMRFEESD